MCGRNEWVLEFWLGLIYSQDINFFTASFTHSFIHPSDKYMLDIHSMPGTILAAGDRVMGKAGFMPSQSCSLGRQTIDQEADTQGKCR